MKLHKAIEKLLQQAVHSMTTRQIADRLNKNKWYQKKMDQLLLPIKFTVEQSTIPESLT